MSSLNKHAYEQAKQFFQKEKYEEALALLDKLDRVLAEDTKNTLLARAKCLAKLGRFEEALEICEKVSSSLGDIRGKALAAALTESAGEALKKAKRVKALHPRRRIRRAIPALAVVVVLVGGIAAVAGYQMLGHDDSSPLLSGTAAAADLAPATKVAQPPPAAAVKREGPQLRLHGLDLEETNLQDAGASPSADDSMYEGAMRLRSGESLRDLVSKPEQKSGSEVAASPTAVQAPKPTPAPDKPVNSILDIQPYLAKQTLTNQRGDEITLTNVNSRVGAWYVLDEAIQGEKVTLHLEVPAINGDFLSRPQLSLYREGLMLAMPGQEPKRFPLWANGNVPDVMAASLVTGGPEQLPAQPILPDVLKPGPSFTSPYTAICEGAVLVRTQKPGSSTKMEAATDLLRTTRVGEWFVAKTKPYLIQEPEIGADLSAANVVAHAAGALAPKDALVDETQTNLYSSPANMAIKADVPDNRFFYGKWYKSTDHPGVFVSLMKAAVVNKQIMASYKDRVGNIGSHDKKRHESEALVYLAAFDLDNFRFGFTMGAEHPKVEWSAKVSNRQKRKGPDGFDTKRPLATVGAIPPYFMPYVEGTFTGGFKRDHGAFLSGPLSKVNNNSHFGFMEEGAIFSKLQPGLATVIMKRDGSIDLVTWPEDSSALLPELAHARQNCVPIIEGFDANGSIPGALVNQWGPGAWSGDQSGDFLSLRAGLAMQENNGHRFLVFAYFTGATPNAMARVFQAYQCRYGMLLDMNTPNYCYCALYGHDDKESVAGAEYLHRDMACGNGNDGSLKFLQKNDTRDFFYILRKSK